MEKSKVYFTDMRTELEQPIQTKLERLLKAAGIETIDFKHKYVAIKIHFGELGNLAYLRPNYAKTVVDLVKALGGRPFLTDCNTLYVGGRKNALEHMETAYINGFSPFSTGCHIIIADGLKGTDEALIPVENGEYIKEAKIGRAISDADIIISLSHFKGHEATGFGGALKNLGMGCGSIGGKMEMHSSGKPGVSTELCISCRKCEKICQREAISFPDTKAQIDHDRCVGCGRCIAVCPVGAIYSPYDEANDLLNKKIAEYSVAVVKDKPHFHISLAIDISPYCDCHAENDAPIIPDLGMFASFDPVALDMACAQMAAKQPAIDGSCLAEAPRKTGDPFHDTHPGTNWEICLEHAEKLKLGSKQYDLIKI